MAEVAPHPRPPRPPPPHPPETWPLPEVRVPDRRVGGVYGVRERAAGTWQGRDMRRRLLIVTIFLMLGAVVNVGVAWGWDLWASVALDSQNECEP